VTIAFKEGGPHLAGLDGLRGAAAMVVVAAHAVAALFVTTHVPVVLAFGVAARAAVILFFVLSGYVIGGSIRTSLATGRFSFVRFAINRVTRIYPAFLLAVALAWLLAWLRSRDLIHSAHPFIAEPMSLSVVAFIRDSAFLFGSGTPMQNANAPVWSLRIEVACYVVSALLALAAQSRSRLGGLAFVAAAAVLTIVCALRLDTAILGFAAFGGGALLAFQPLRIGPRVMLPVALAAVLAFAATAIAPFVVADPIAFVKGPFFDLYQAAMVVASALLIVSTAESAGRSDGWAARLAPLAPFSYTLFITHVPLIGITLGVVRPPDAIAVRIASAGLIFIGAVAFAACAALLVEQHRTLRRWLASRQPIKGLLAWDARR
jgi:peptidoglycan/LPS O-acetylase OafA/YrhL